MRIHALNVSKPKTIVYKGEELFTGIYKVPTAEPRMVRILNIDGDEQADLTVHGGVDKAVYGFPFEHYSYYQEKLKQDSYEPGQFGENLTTEGLFESDVHIGDRYRVGEVVLEVSQPRSPCYKFAIKMETAKALSLCINSAKTGFYFRVLCTPTLVFWQVVVTAAIRNTVIPLFKRNFKFTDSQIEIYLNFMHRFFIRIPLIVSHEKGARRNYQHKGALPTILEPILQRMRHPVR